LALRQFELDIEPLDLGQTLGCGQTFRWRCQQDGSWIGILSKQVVELKEEDGLLKARADPGNGDFQREICRYLRASDDVSEIQRILRKDKVMAPGIRKMRGLRIVKIDEWECLASYVLATYANIPRISKMIESIAREYGTKIREGSYAFPSPHELGRASVKELAGCGLGYRAAYLNSLCREIDEQRLDELKKLGYEELREELIQLPGVGDKVADCVCLFGFGKLESFPIDVWIERALSRLYKQKGTYRSLRGFAKERFGKYAGYAQEYLYYNERAFASEGACMFTRR